MNTHIPGCPYWFLIQQLVGKSISLSVMSLPGLSSIKCISKPINRPKY